MVGRWRLESMTVRGFRGFVKNQPFSFSEPLTLLDGPQGSGKSSTLVAIEWCLFGDEIAKKGCGIDERKGWKVRNSNAQEARVELSLDSEGNTLRIVRSDKKTKDIPQFYFEVNGSKYTDEKALRALLGIEFKDYFGSVHLHQEVIKALLIVEPRYRKDLIDRLLGLSELRNIMDGVKAAKIAGSLSDVDDRFNQIETNLNAIVTNKQIDIKKEKGKGVMQGLKEDDFSKNGADRMCKKVKAALVAFARQVGLTISELPVGKKLDELQGFTSSAREIVRNLRDEQPDLKRQVNLLQKQLALQSLNANYTECLGNLQTFQLARRQIWEVDGDQNEISSRISKDLLTKLETARKRRTQIDKRAGTIEEALKYFESIKPVVGKQTCPVCEKTIDDPVHIINHLEQLRDSLGEDLAPITEEISKYDTEIVRLNTVVEELNRLDKKITAHTQIVARCKEEIAAVIGREIKDTDDTLIVVQSELELIVNELKELATVVAEANQKLNSVEDNIVELDTILSVLALEAATDDLLKITRTDEYKKVVECKMELEKFAMAVNILTQAIGNVLKKSAQAKLDTAKDNITSMFKALANRPEYSEFQIEPDSFELIVVEGMERTPALSVLNEGDLNCAGLSVFLGLGAAQELCHKLGFVILDDPSQSLDSPHKQNLVKILNHMPDDKQILIASSDPDLCSLISSSIIRKKKCYRFEQRSASEGVRFK